MKPSEYSEMYRLETFYWWFVARRKLLRSLVRAIAGTGSRILDVGCGTGINYATLAECGKVVGIDESEEALQLSRERGASPLVLSDSEVLPFKSDSFGVVTALDVLEHIDDDLAGLGELARVVKPGGSVLITVPAYGFLWSEHDEALDHRRRYAASELRNKVTRAGLTVERVSYYIMFLFFPILFVRLMQSVFKKSVYPKTSHILLPQWLNSMLIGILDVERLLLRWMNFPFGVSLICVARK